MADKLRDDPMWRDRLVNFVRDNLGPNPLLKPMSGTEMKILEKIDTFKAIDKELPNGLYTLLNSVKNYITPFAALKILLYWHEKGDLNVGYEILYFSARDERAFSEEEIKQLIKILNDDPRLNIAWLMTIFANPEVAVEEPPPPLPRNAPKPSSLKLPSNFK